MPWSLFRYITFFPAFKLLVGDNLSNEAQKYDICQGVDWRRERVAAQP